MRFFAATLLSVAVGSERRIFSGTGCVSAVKVIQGRWFWHQLKGRVGLPITYWSYLASFLRYGDVLAENCQFFLPHSHLTPSIGVNPFEFLDEVLIPETRVIGLSGEDFVILVASFWLNASVWQTDVGETDRETDRQTDGHPHRS